MAVIVKEIRLPLEAGEEEAFAAAVKRAGLQKSEVADAYIMKTSVDARHRNRISLVYSVGLSLKGGEPAEERAAAATDAQIVLRKAAPDALPGWERGGRRMEHRPVIAGFGPAGMFAGLFLSRLNYRPLIVERGADMDGRVAQVERFWRGGVLSGQTNVQFGEGGAGTFSDGKLTTRINDPRCETVLNEFVRFGAPEEIRKAAKPHIGTDRLRGIVRALRGEIERNGGEVRFCTRLAGLAVKDGRLRGVTLDDGRQPGGGAVGCPADVLILAVGHSARDTFRMTREAGLAMEAKPFSVGVRIEHLQSEIEKGLYGALAGHPALPRGEYQLSFRSGGRAVYTFCMCPGGTVVAAASEPGGVVTNGMSTYSRDGKNANAALVVSVDSRDFGPEPFDGMSFQRRLEAAAWEAAGKSYRAPYQNAGAFLKGSGRIEAGRVAPTYPVGVAAARLDQLFPEQITSMLKTGLRVFDRKISGFAAPDALLTGVETRTSSPVRILRGESLEACGLSGIYPAGEGAGYAGGIVSAAVDGMRVAQAVVSQYSPPA